MTPTNAHEHLRLVRSLFPELAAGLDEAHERARLRTADRGEGESPAAPDLDTWLDGEADRLRAGELGRAPFARLSATAAERFERAFAAARSAADHLGVRCPEPESFVTRGVDLARLGSHLDADPSLRPVPAPYGLGPDAWRAAFRDAAGGAEGFLSGSAELPDPLLLAAEAVAEFASLDALPDPGIPVVPATLAGEAAATWTLRLVPADAKPPVLGLGYAHGPHVSLPEMLMLQLMRNALGEPPVDTSSFTWLAGELADGRLAARHVFDEREGVIRVNCREVGNQGPHLGARPPVSEGAQTRG